MTSAIARIDLHYGWYMAIDRLDKEQLIGRVIDSLGDDVS